MKYSQKRGNSTEMAPNEKHEQKNTREILHLYLQGFKRVIDLEPPLRIYFSITWTNQVVNARLNSIDSRPVYVF